MVLNIKANDTIANTTVFVGLKSEIVTAQRIAPYKTVTAPPRILRVDDKALNPKYVNAVVRKRSG